MKDVIFKILTILLAMFLTGCLDENSKQRIKEELFLDKASSSILIGNWETLCISGNENSIKKSYTFSESFYNYSEVKYLSSSDCSGKYTNSRQSGSYTVGDNIVTSSGINAIEINFTFENSNKLTNSYNIIGLQEKGNYFYLGRKSENSLLNRPIELNYEISFKLDVTPKTVVTFFNDLDSSVTAIFVKLNRAELDIEDGNLIDSPLRAGESVKISVFCNDYIDIRVKSDSKIIENRTNVQLQCNKNYSWPIDGN